MSTLDELRAELDDIRAQFGSLNVSEAPDVLYLVTCVRGVEVNIFVPLSRYPELPPNLYVTGRWIHPNVAASGAVIGLDSLQSWNRTLGMGLLLRELQQSFTATPPRRTGWLRGFLARWFGR